MTTEPARVELIENTGLQARRLRRPKQPDRYLKRTGQGRQQRSGNALERCEIHVQAVRIRRKRGGLQSSSRSDHTKKLNTTPQNSVEKEQSHRYKTDAYVFLDEHHVRHLHVIVVQKIQTKLFS